jgi:hypothetical protein
MLAASGPDDISATDGVRYMFTTKWRWKTNKAGPWPSEAWTVTRRPDLGALRIRVRDDRGRVSSPCPRHS